MNAGQPRFALLQQALDQTIDRAAFEEAAIASRSIPRPDCPGLVKELFGIVVRDLAHDRAVALQTELGRRGFPTDIVPQDQLPPLGEPTRLIGLRFDAQAFERVDLYGRATAFPWDQFVFAAAGFIVRLRQREAGQHEEVVHRGRSGTVRQTVTDYRQQDVPEFRLEMFFAVPPYRLQCVLDPDHTLNLNGAPVTLRQQPKLIDLLQQLAKLLPANRLNSGIRKLSTGGYFVYPGVRAFEEEIIWSFYRLLTGVSGNPL